MLTQKASLKGNAHTIIGTDGYGRSIYFDEICDGLYDYVLDEGYKNLGPWIENAAKKHNK